MKIPRFLLIIFGTIASLYLVACLLLFFLQTRFIFVPDRRVYRTPMTFKLRSQEVWIPVKTASGKIERIHAWWIPADRSTGTLLYFHGNGGTSGGVDQAARFHRLGLSVLLISYRGYGLSEGGFPSEAQVYEDAQAAWNYLVSDRKIPAHQIVIYGYSFGGAVAIDLAVKQPTAKALIVQSSFTSMEDMANRVGFQYFPVKLLLNQRFDSIQKVPSLRMPVLFMHGAADTLVPPTMSQALYAAAPSPKKLLLVPGAQHNDAELGFNKAEHFEEIQKFLEAARP